MKIELDDMLSRSAEAESFLKQLANSKRLMILCVLSEGELSVGVSGILWASEWLTKTLANNHHSIE